MNYNIGDKIIIIKNGYKGTIIKCYNDENEDWGDYYDITLYDNGIDIGFLQFINKNNFKICRKFVIENILKNIENNYN